MVDVSYEDYQDLVRKLSLANERVRDLQERVSGRDAHIAALEARLAERVRVKPLEWRKGRAETPFGPYHVIEETHDDGEPFWFVMFNGKAAAMCGTHDNEGSAIFAAQADYERRILSALEATPPAPEQRELSAEDVATFDRALLRSGRKAEATPPAQKVTEEMVQAAWVRASEMSVGTAMANKSALREVLKAALTASEAK